MLKHTKIVATVSDQRCEVEFIDALYKAGMNVVRLNTAHMAEEGLTRVVNNVRTVSNRIGILMDTKGPEVRTTAAQAPIEFKTGEMVKIVGNPEGETSHDCICVSYRNFVNDLTVGSDILIDDGDLELKVIDKKDDFLVCEVENDATLGSRKSVNVPGVRINLPSLTEKDRKNILWAIENDLDFIAHSFVRNKQDVMDIQRILDEHNSPIKIIAKIENQEGVDNIDEILEVAYGIMIARGDLGIEVPAEKIPVEAVQTMTKVAREAEKTKLAANDIRVPIEGNDLDVTSFLAKQAVKSSSKLHVKAIITDSYTGRTARYLAAFRGTSTVFSICYNPRVMRMLSLSYGVWAVHQPYNDSRRGYFYDALNELIKSGRITRNDMVAYLSGSFGEGGGTSFLEINNVGKVLDAGSNYQLPTFKE
mgnify:CR=1 FL=1